MIHLIETVYRFLWGDLFVLPIAGGVGISLMVVLLLMAGVFFTLRTRLLPVRLFRDMIAAVCEKNQNKEGLSSFQTLVVSTATRVGMGNLVGVVAAVSAGGAGAVFWMWVTALLGASGIVFMLIMLSSLAGFSGGIPVTMLLVAALYFGQQVYDIILVHDNVANFMHIVGGLCGTAFGYYFALPRRKRRR